MAKDKFQKGTNSDDFNTAVTPVDLAINRFLATGDDAVLKTFYKPKTTESEIKEALTEFSKHRFPDARSMVKAYVETGLKLPDPNKGSTLEEYAAQIDFHVHLERAARVANPEIVKMLLEAGADVNRKDTTGKPAAAKPNTPQKL